jgi:(1->4)-alpha-D-glucan 1-alpha-D-glucosylmutase
VASVFDFIRDTILLRNIGDFAEEDRPRLIRWTMKFQQLTGPVLAKGLEDTAFYIYNRLVSLNEVGGHPDHFGSSVADFHRHNHDTLQNWPHAVLTTATHDTKRGEDVRARLNVLSEIPEQWQAALARWTDLNDAKKNAVDGRLAPSRNDEYLLYQTLIGAWPIEPLDSNGFQYFRDRILAYMQKATKEAKVHTSWINPDPDYDAAVREFVMRLLPDDPEDPFLKDLLAFQRPVAFCGYFNSLAQVLLKLTSPGVPDMYQGTELWDLSLVDPDNRRPVDYERRRTLLDRIKHDLEQFQDNLALFLRDLLAQLPDGRVKMYLIYRVLNYRRGREDFFARCDYEPLNAIGEKQEHVCAFSRLMEDEMIVVVVPRLVYRLTNGGQTAPMGANVWRDTRLVIPFEQCPSQFRNLLTGQAVRMEPAEGSSTISISLAAILEQFPVAILEGRRESSQRSRDHSA